MLDKIATKTVKDSALNATASSSSEQDEVGLILRNKDDQMKRHYNVVKLNKSPRDRRLLNLYRVVHGARDRETWMVDLRDAVQPQQPSEIHSFV